MCFSVFTCLFINSKRILETLKIIGFESLCNKDSPNPKTKNFQNRGCGQIGLHAQVRSIALQSISFFCAQTQVCLIVVLGARALVCSITGLLRSIALSGLQLLLDHLLAFPNSCPLSPKLPKYYLFFQRPIKQRK